MAEAQEPDYSPEQYAAYMEERKTLIEAARESARTFDQAVLAFGAAVFGASIAFLKDVAPHPERYTLKWLGLSWFLFSCGLLVALVSFIFSHKACMFEVDAGSETLGNPKAVRTKNKWSTMTDWCNYSCVGLLFVGLFCWSIFSLENLNQGGNTMAEHKVVCEKLQEGYTPPKAPPPPPPSPQSPPPAPAQK